MKHFKFLFGFVLGGLLFLGCEAEPEPEPEEEPLVYTGKTELARIPADGAYTLLGPFFGLVASGPFLGNPLGNTASGFRTGIPANSLVTRVDVIAKTAAITKAAVMSFNDQQNGSCGGISEVDITIDDESGAFSGTTKYNDFCEGGLLIDGEVSIEGMINFFGPFSNPLFTFEMTFTAKVKNLRISSESNGADITQYGTVKMLLQTDERNSDYTSYSTDELLIRNNTINEVVRVENFSHTEKARLPEQAADSDKLIYKISRTSGNVYLPDLGMFIFETSKPVTSVAHLEGEGGPIQGEYLVRGAENTSQKVEIECQTSIKSSLDLDGDGNYESSTVLPLGDPSSSLGNESLCDRAPNPFDEN